MKRTIGWVVAALALVGAACGNAADVTTPPTSALVDTTVPTSTEVPALFPVTLTSEAGTISLFEAPERIAALSAAHVEMLYAMGAGDQVIAGDLFSDYPPETEALIKVDSFNLSVESVIELDPDLVVLTFDPGDAVAAFAAVGIPTILFSPAPTIESAFEQMQTLGAATGHGAGAEALIVAIRSDIASIVATVGDLGTGLTYYHETDPFSFYTPNSDSFIGQLYGLLGLENIADAAPDEFGSGYPQLSPEFIIESDPDLVFLGAAGEDATTLAARDGWGTLSAIAAGRVVVVDADESSRWGPRIVDFMGDIADAILALELVGG